MNCPSTCFYLKKHIDPPKDSEGKDIFLWNRVLFGCMDEWDTEGYVIEVLGTGVVRVLIPTYLEEDDIEVIDMPTNQLQKQDDHVRFYG